MLDHLRLCVLRISLLRMITCKKNVSVIQKTDLVRATDTFAAKGMSEM